ncbi:MAG: GerAB/ArcD/ProY family transporter [Bacillota bacterium]|nr:GerAB/ArcD/ProY family transporter [Bacillota bacterium]
MDNRENQITSRQLMGILLSIQLGIGMLTLPADLSVVSGHDGWIPVLLYGIILTAVIALMMKLLNRYDNQSIFEINKYIYGKYIGWIFNLLIIAYFWYSSCLSFRIYINILHVQVLRTTPSLILDIFIILPIYYLTWNGLKYVSRITFLIYISLAFFLILFVLVLKDIRLTFLMPVGECGLEGIKAGIKPCVFAYLGYELIPIIYPEITNKQKAMKYSLFSNIIVTLFFLMLVLVTTSFFGEEMLKKSMYPIIKLSRSYKAIVIDRIDLLFIVFWLVSQSIAFTAYFSVTYYSMHKILKFTRKTLYLIVFTIITILLSNIPKSNSQLTIYNDIMTVSGFSFTILLIVSYFFSFIRKKGVR